MDNVLFFIFNNMLYNIKSYSFANKTYFFGTRLIVMYNNVHVGILYNTIPIMRESKNRPLSRK